MNDRTYFLLGDIAANVTVGALAGLAAALITDPDWWMLPAMLVGYAAFVRPDELERFYARVGARSRRMRIRSQPTARAVTVAD